jgi:hypothetical protein
MTFVFNPLRKINRARTGLVGGGVRQKAWLKRITRFNFGHNLKITMIYFYAI